MEILREMIGDARTAVIVGHIRPDGDCVGSCLGMYNYLSDNYKDMKVRIFLEPPSGKFSYLKNFDRIEHELTGDLSPDLCLCLDSSDRERLGTYDILFQRAKRTVCIDHHITNGGFAMVNRVEPRASSACEVLFGVLDEKKISLATAECLYTGIVHDTGVFKHSNTTGKTMAIAGKLLDMGIDGEKIIDDSFFRKSYVQNQILGRALLESVVFMDGKCIFSAVKAKDMEFYGADSRDLDGIVDQLRVTGGVECAIFIYESGVHQYKVSMRANGDLNVAKVASYFGGGGHVKAAGCTMTGSIYDVINNLSVHIERQLKELGILGGDGRAAGHENAEA